MSKEIIRIGIYWYPPRELGGVVHQLWRGELTAKYLVLERQWRDKDQSKAEEYGDLAKACDLVARHCGDCPIWLTHATILDAICILAEDRDSFIQVMRDVARQFLPIRLSKPEIREWGWGNNVFLRWEDGQGTGVKRMRDFRRAVAEKAGDFMVVERVSWEAINDMERLLASVGLLVRSEFRRALEDLKALLRTGAAPRLPHAPNVGIEWYLDRLAAGSGLRDDKLPFAPSPHVSIASGVRDDDKYGIPAKEVGDHIKEHLPNLEEFRGLLGDGVVHSVDSIHIVEPAPPYIPPTQVTVVDRPTGRARMEFRQCWRPVEELVSGKSYQSNLTMVMWPLTEAANTELVATITMVIKAVYRKMTDDIRFAGAGFDCYEDCQYHATILGMEVAEVQGHLVNLNFLRSDGVLRTPQSRPLLGLLASLARENRNNPIFQIQFGGWPKTHCQCKGDDLLAWECKTGSSPLHSYSRTPYEGSFYIGSEGQVLLTGWQVAGKDGGSTSVFPHAVYRFRADAAHVGYLDAYHRADRPDWRDDDFYIRLGTLRNCSDTLREELVSYIRDVLANAEPVIVPVHLSNLTIVYYRDRGLRNIIESVPAKEAIQQPELLDQLYDRWLRDRF